MVRRASSTCRSWLLATSVTTGAPESRRAATRGSSAAFAPGRRVAPNAASCACFRSSSVRARRKNSVSLGLAPGQPPSMNPTPRLVEVARRPRACRRPRRPGPPAGRRRAASCRRRGSRSRCSRCCSPTKKDPPRSREVCASAGRAPAARSARNAAGGAHHRRECQRRPERGTPSHHPDHRSRDPHRIGHTLVVPIRCGSRSGRGLRRWARRRCRSAASGRRPAAA